MKSKNVKKYHVSFFGGEEQFDIPDTIDCNGGTLVCQEVNNYARAIYTGRVKNAFIHLGFEPISDTQGRDLDVFIGNSEDELEDNGYIDPDTGIEGNFDLSEIPGVVEDGIQWANDNYYLNPSKNVKKSKIEYDYDGIYAIPRTNADSIYHVVGMNVSPSFASLTDDELGIFDSNFEPTIITSFDSFDEARQWIDQNQDRTKRVVGIRESKRNDIGYGFGDMIWTVKSTKKSYTPNYQDFRSMVKSIKNTGNHNNVFKE